MNKNKPLCPPAEKLADLLSEETETSATANAREHISHCSPCQERLERITNNMAAILNRPGREGVSESEREAALEELIQRLRRTPPEDAVTLNLRYSTEPDTHVPFSFPSPPTDEAPLGELGSFQILEPLGNGTTGLVFLARDKKLNRKVAIKIMRPELVAYTNACARFEREARLAASVRHRNIVAVFDVGKEPDFPPFLVMEFIAGKSLSEILKEGEATSLRERVAIVHQITLGLTAAHEHGLVHRDIKPSNILLAEGSGEAKISDFGLAIQANADITLTQEGQVLGTPAYMSPEQASGNSHQVDSRSDIYSLGVVLYQLLGGRPPFDGCTREVLYQIIHEEPKPLRIWNNRIPRDLEAITMKCLAKDPAERYPSSKELAQDMQRWLNGEPVRLPKAGFLYRSGKWLRRKQKAIALGCLGLVLLLVAAFGVTAALRQYRHRQQLEEFSQQRNLLISWQRKGEQSLNRKEYQKARRQLQKARTIAETLVKVHPKHLQLKEDLILLYQQLGETAHKLNEDSQAEKYYKAGLELALAWWETDKKGPARNLLASTYLGLGKVCKEPYAGYYLRLAIQSFEELENERQNDPRITQAREEQFTGIPKSDLLKINLLLLPLHSLVQKHQHREIKEIAETLRKFNPGDPDILYNVSRCYSLSLEAMENGKRELTQEEIDQRELYLYVALSDLEKAVDAGFNNAVLLRNDADLRPLRNEPCFTGLLRKLEGQFVQTQDPLVLEQFRRGS